jgi:hypothetical protein
VQPDVFDISILDVTVHRPEAGEKDNWRIVNCRLSSHIMRETEMQNIAGAGTRNVTAVIDRKGVN